MAIAVSVTLTSLSGPAYAAAEFTVYKSPWCGCCSKWVDHLQANGHMVTTKDIENLDTIKKMAGVPERLQSCHTAIVDGYVVEGHVPAKDITRLLAERPKAKGLAVPGMPAGSPGMEGSAPDKYDVMLFKTDGSADVFSRH
ncbi:MAG: DUF411 domain-containing protein [Boseongicola sp.]|nr:DUF411 domain-containing protein [Boseongicola sp.]